MHEQHVSPANRRGQVIEPGGQTGRSTLHLGADDGGLAAGSGVTAEGGKGVRTAVLEPHVERASVMVPHHQRHRFMVAKGVVRRGP